MTILILDDNLMWTEKLRRSVIALGHTPVVGTKVPEQPAEVAILNLGNPKLSSPEILAALRQQRTYMVGHAGHKEKDLLLEGTKNGVDRVVTNSQLTFKLDDILANIPSDFLVPDRLN